VAKCAHCKILFENTQKGGKKQIYCNPKCTKAAADKRRKHIRGFRKKKLAWNSAYKERRKARGLPKDCYETAGNIKMCEICETIYISRSKNSSTCSDGCYIKFRENEPLLRVGDFDILDYCRSHRKMYESEYHHLKKYYNQTPKEMNVELRKRVAIERLGVLVVKGVIPKCLIVPFCRTIIKGETYVAYTEGKQQDK